MDDALQRAIELLQGQAGLAAKLSEELPDGEKIGSTAVANWVKRGLPDRWTIPVARATDWRVTPHELRGDLYPNVLDALPPEVQLQRAAAA